ncbi:putative phosphoethanolamine N-methyltransferase [Rosa chinensis]|uniref:Putative phosphoethanolamine N-methyltransferase n=1 Tax=Rosa chinensis TaxID=74649 RepID=A0A2P6Q9L1_ROSCH|nr:putative phosphoethanolamine N-methyltransferase [Rosa chinensis]
MHSLKFLQRELNAVEKDKDAFIEDFYKEDYNDMVDGRQRWLGLTLESRSGASSLPRINGYYTSSFAYADAKLYSS